MPEKTTALHRRLAPFVPITLELADGEGGKLILNLKLCFDFNAIAAIEEKTNLTLGNMWQAVSSGRVLSVMLWAACLAYQPDYEGDEGLAIIRSYMDLSNSVEITLKLLDAFIASLPKDKHEAMQKLKEKLVAGEENPTPGAPGIQ